MKKTVLIAVILVYALIALNCSARAKRERASKAMIAAASGTLAVSLKALQAKLKACQPEGSCDQAILEFAGIKKIAGFVADEANRDLILFGHTDPDLPPLYLEDFVVALRNAWHKDAKLVDGVYRYSHPGCSIDPTERVVLELQSLKQRMSGGGSGGGDAFIEQWRRTCQKPQKVRVFGMPFDTHFAKVLVQADYDLKTLADGSDQINTPGFISITDMKLGKARQAVLSNQPVVLPASGMNRFWFYPGEISYQESDGVVLLRDCSVRLLTEHMYPGAGGRLTGSGGAEPAAQTFADNFTALYGKVAELRRVYLELESLFRFVALAQAIRFKYPDSVASFDLSYLLDDYQVPVTPLKQELPGRASVKGFEHRRDFERGYQTIQLQFPSCGGVDIGIEAKADNFVPDAAGTHSSLREAILAGARMAPSKLYWGFQDKAGFLDKVKNVYARLREINRSNRESRLFTIENKGDKFIVISESEERPFGIDNFAGLVKYVNKMVEGTGTKAINFDLKNFATDDKIKVFAWNCQKEQQALKSKLAMRNLPREGDSTELQDALLTPGVQLKADGEIPIVRLTEGRYKDWYQAKVDMVVQVKGKLKDVALVVRARTFEMAQAFIRIIVNLLSGSASQSGPGSAALLSRLGSSSDPGFKVASLLDIRIRADAKMRELFPGMKDGDVEVELDDAGKSSEDRKKEVGRRYVVKLEVAEPREVGE